MKNAYLSGFYLMILFMLSTCIFAQKGDWNQLDPPNAPSARQGHSMVTLPDGRVVLFGGEGPQEDLFNDLFIYQEDDWEEVTPANNPPPARSFHSTWAEGEDMFIYGGKGNGTLLNDLWKFDVNTNLWYDFGNPAGSMLQRHSASSNVLPDGSVVIFGGKDGNGTRLKDCWKITNNTASQLSDCMSDYAYHFGKVISDGIITDILYFGRMNFLCTYSVDNDQWDLNGFANTYRGHGSSVSGLNDLDEEVVFIFGGLDENDQACDIVYEYNCNTGTLTQREEPLPGKVMNNASAKYFYDKDDNTGFNYEEYEVLMFGGVIDGIVSDETWMSTSSLLKTNQKVQPDKIDITIGPNPTAGPLRIISDVLVKNIAVYDQSGRLLKKSNIENKNFRIDLSTLNSGVYLLSAETENGSYYKKVIIQ